MDPVRASGAAAAAAPLQAANRSGAAGTGKKAGGQWLRPVVRDCADEALE